MAYSKADVVQSVLITTLICAVAVIGLGLVYKDCDNRTDAKSECVRQTKEIRACGELFDRGH